MLVVLKIGWCGRESNEMLILMLQLQGKKQKKKWFSPFLCTERQQTGLQNNQICFRPGGFAPLDPPAGHCPCTPPGPWQPLDLGHSGSVSTPQALFPIPMPGLQSGLTRSCQWMN